MISLSITKKFYIFALFFVIPVFPLATFDFLHCCFEFLNSACPLKNKALTRSMEGSFYDSLLVFSPIQQECRFLKLKGLAHAQWD
jgi:hypothetical protein